jgi:hypothetical protein
MIYAPYIKVRHPFRARGGTLACIASRRSHASLRRVRAGLVSVGGSGFSADFVTWYNHDHHHDGLAMPTPAKSFRSRSAVHPGASGCPRQGFDALPERFPRGRPAVREVWINKPKATRDSVSATGAELTAEAISLESAILL